MKFRSGASRASCYCLRLQSFSSYCAAQAPAQAGAAFPPLEQWKAAVISGNVAALQALYSSNPPAQVATAAGASNVTSEIAFWTGLKARRMKLNVIQSESPQPGVQQVVFQAEVHTSAGARHST